jgi:Predicted integral membrane protein
MGFWIFMLAMDLAVPAVMIVFGSVCRKGAPKDINHVFGYRTTMSMKNKDTWEFAHRHCGRVWRLVGWILLVLSAAAMFFAWGKEIDAVGNFGLILILVQTVILLISIAPTEIALRKTFDEDGRRKQQL